MAEGGNAALRALLAESALSNTALSRSVQMAGAREGVHVGTTATSVRRMLDGAQPWQPVPRLVAGVLSQRLGREISVTECGFAVVVVSTQDRVDGLRCSGTLDGTVRTVLQMSGDDMNRRNLLKGSAFAVAGFAQPALFALTVPPAEGLARVGGRRIGPTDVQVITEHLAHLRRLDHHYGAGRVRVQVLHLLHAEANTVLHSSYSEATGRALLEAVAQASWLAGSMASDIGRHALAQQYYVQALNLAMSAGSRLYAANVLSHMSRLTLQIGHGTNDRDDRVLHARQAIALARGGIAVAGGEATPALQALLRAVESRGHGLAGDALSAHAARREAERQYARHHHGDGPGWLGFYTQAEIDADLGRCLRDLGDTKPAVDLLDHALAGYEPWRARSRCFVHTDLALTHLRAGEHAQATAAGRTAMAAAGPVRSARTTERLRTLQLTVRPAGQHSVHLRELDDELTEFLTRAARTASASQEVPS
jgi:hypothetical protein